MPANKPYSLSDAKKLIILARRAIENTLSGKDVKDDKLELEFSKKQGVFVTLNKKGDLRGCIGFVLPYYSIYQGIVQCAKSAAFEDPRFEPVKKDEMKDISIDISILTVPEEIKSEKKELPNKIKIGRDGLILRYGPYSGLLLPQVFVEYKSTPLEALEMTCQKAGVPKDAWKMKEAKIESFQAQVFKEISPKGDVEEEKFSG
jgi:uncharacterized protein (TIGR00296 family)